MGATIKHINNILFNPDMDEATKNDVAWQHVDFMLVSRPVLFDVDDIHKGLFYSKACKTWTQL